MRTTFVIEGPAARRAAEELAALGGLSAVVRTVEPVVGAPRKDPVETLKMIVEVVSVVGSTVETAKLIIDWAHKKRRREPPQIERIVVIRDERRLLDRLDAEHLAELLEPGDDPVDPESPRA